jgi:hypothetical protein
MSLRRLHGGRVLGNREVSHLVLVGRRGDLRAATADACLEEEGGSWGKHGFLHGSGATVEVAKS